jgi:hypothetical protein
VLSCRQVPARLRVIVTRRPKYPAARAPTGRAGAAKQPAGSGWAATEAGEDKKLATEKIEGWQVVEAHYSDGIEG